ncbi:MAG: hypothetical protein WD355_00725 [Balneolaceae bacterium]
MASSFIYSIFRSVHYGAFEKTGAEGGIEKPGFLVKIKARGILKPQHIEYM